MSDRNGPPGRVCSGHWADGVGCWAVTAEGSIRLVMATAQRGCRLIHVSSDAVFSGAWIHYDETCLPDQVTPYGAAKVTATAVRLLAPAAAGAHTLLITGPGPAAPDQRPPCAGKRGRPRGRPDVVVLGDRRYGHDTCRRVVRELGVTPVAAARRGVEQ